MKIEEYLHAIHEETNPERVHGLCSEFAFRVFCALHDSMLKCDDGKGAIIVSLLSRDCSEIKYRYENCGRTEIAQITEEKAKVADVFDIKNPNDFTGSNFDWRIGSLLRGFSHLDTSKLDATCYPKYRHGCYYMGETPEQVTVGYAGGLKIPLTHEVESFPHWERAGHEVVVGISHTSCREIEILQNAITGLE